MKFLYNLFKQQTPKNQKVIVLVAIAAIVYAPILMVSNARSGSAPRTSVAQTKPKVSAPERKNLTLLSYHEFGYGVYTDGNCLVIQGMTVPMLQKHGMSLSEFEAEMLRKNPEYPCISLSAFK